MAEIINAKDAAVKFNDKLIGCKSSADLNMDQEVAETTCQQSGNWKEFSAGRKSWTATISGIYRELSAAELAAGVSFDTLFDGFDTGSTVKLEYGKEDGTGTRYSGNAIITNLKLTFPEKDACTWSASFQGTGPLNKI